MKKTGVIAVGAALALSVGLFAACTGGTSSAEITADTDRASIVSQQLSREDWAQAFGGMPSGSSASLDDNYSMQLDAAASVAVLRQVVQGGTSTVTNMTLSFDDAYTVLVGDGDTYRSDNCLRTSSSIVTGGEQESTTRRDRVETYYMAEGSDAGTYTRSNPANAGWSDWTGAPYDEAAAREAILVADAGAFAAFDLADRYDCFSYDDDEKAYVATGEGLETITADLRDWLNEILQSRLEGSAGLSGGTLQLGGMEVTVDALSLKFSDGRVCLLQYSLGGQFAMSYTDAQGVTTSYSVILASASGEAFCYDRGRTSVALPDGVVQE